LTSVDQHGFDAYVQANAGGLRVARAALLFAVDRYPDIDVDAYLDRLDRLAETVDQSHACEAPDRIAALRRAIVDRHGFCGHPSEMCDPRCSYLNKVLERASGLPIALAVIWLDVADKLGWPLRGVGLPGRFLVADFADPHKPLYVDPFDGGRTFDRAGCAALVAECFGRAVTLTDAHLAPTTNRAILTRMLANLRSVYAADENWRQCERVLLRMLALEPGDSDLECQIRHVRGRIGAQN
jgi:regulator of sirC expression with transglutaminase-like and TPR domain